MARQKNELEKCPSWLTQGSHAPDCLEKGLEAGFPDQLTFSEPCKMAGQGRGVLYTQRQEGLYIQKSLTEPLYCSLYNYTAS